MQFLVAEVIDHKKCVTELLTNARKRNLRSIVFDVVPQINDCVETIPISFDAQRLEANYDFSSLEWILSRDSFPPSWVSATRSDLFLRLLPKRIPHKKRLAIMNVYLILASRDCGLHQPHRRLALLKPCSDHFLVRRAGLVAKDDA